MLYRKDNLEKCTDALLHDVLLIISIRYAGKFRSCYVDPHGGIFINFDVELEADEIKDVLIQFANEDIERDKMEINYDENYAFGSDNQTYVYPKYVAKI